MRRQALHAWRLAFSHPGSGGTIDIDAEMPEDMQSLLTCHD
jgi:23S rRNA-/tRNA-specific pseudouridylate synthase